MGPQYKILFTAEVTVLSSNIVLTRTAQSVFELLLLL